MEGQTSSFYEFLRRGKKGSKKFLNVLTYENSDHIPHNIVKFADNTETIINLETSQFLNSSWKYGLFSSSCKTFCFKLFNNILGYNHVISHFLQGHTRNCTFCNIGGNQWEEDETPLHLFFACAIIENLRIFFYDTTLNYFITRQEFFAIPTRPNKDQNIVIFYTTLLFKKYVWECKQRQTLPEPTHLKSFIFRELFILCNISTKFRLKILNSELGEDFIRNCSH
jgi:hypothetical protein